MDARLSKSERISSVKAIDSLIARGRYVVAGPLRCCYHSGAQEDDPQSGNRILVSVPKRLFKRAVKRNLLKRRIREAYRLQKGALHPCGVDMMFVYTSKEVSDFDVVCSSVQQILARIDERLADK